MKKTVSILKVLLGIILLSYFVVFSYQNMVPVSIHFLGYAPFNLPLFLILLLPSATVIVAALIITRLKSISRLRKFELLEKSVSIKDSNIHQLTEELEHLRAVKGDSSPIQIPKKLPRMFEEKNYMLIFFFVVAALGILLTLVVYMYTRNVWVYVGILVPLLIMVSTFLLVQGLKKRLLSLFQKSPNHAELSQRVEILGIPFTILISSSLLSLVYITTILIFLIQRFIH